MRTIKRLALRLRYSSKKGVKSTLKANAYKYKTAREAREAGQKLRDGLEWPKLRPQ